MAISATFMAGNGTTTRLTSRLGLDRLILLGSCRACAALCSRAVRVLLAGFLQMAAAACAQRVGTLPQGTPWPMMAVMLACAGGMVWATLQGGRGALER
jgi:hypothetical protein